MHTFAIADDWPDVQRADELLAGAGIEMAGDGSRTAGYLLFSPEAKRAQSHLSSAHVFRTGDLHLFLLQHPRPIGQPLHGDDLRDYWEYRGSLGRQRDLTVQLHHDGRDPHA